MITPDYIQAVLSQGSPAQAPIPTPAAFTSQPNQSLLPNQPDQASPSSTGNPLLDAALHGAMFGAAASGQHPAFGAAALLHGLSAGDMTADLKSQLPNGGVVNPSFTLNGQQHTAQGMGLSAPPYVPNSDSIPATPKTPDAPDAPVQRAPTALLPDKPDSATPVSAFDTPTPTPFADTSDAVSSGNPVPYLPTQIDTKLPEYAEDPRVSHLFDTAQTLRKEAMNLPTPQMPGMSLVQALVGIAGAIATQKNPHAQFVANYLPSLGQAIQQQYGNTQQAWQVARENLLSQADSMAKQAGAIQEAGLKKYSTDVGYGGKIGAAAIQGQSRISVANLNANARTLATQITQAGTNGKTAAKLILQGGPAGEAAGYTMLRASAPGLSGWSDEQIAEAAKQLDARQILEGAQADNQTSQAGLNSTKAGDITATQPSRIALNESRSNYFDSGAAYKDALARFVPATVAAKIQDANNYAYTVQQNALNAGNRNQFGYAQLSEKTFADTQNGIQKGIDAVKDQADTLRNVVKPLVQQRAAIQDPNSPQAKMLDSQIGQYNDAVKAMNMKQDALNHAISTLRTNFQPAQAPAQNVPQAPGVLNPLALPPGVSMSPIAGGITSKGALPGASNAVAQASQPKPLPGGMSRAQALAQARAAIASGKDKNAVVARLKQYGIVLQ